jgi:thiol-disulfide isomerase/thioredoxin
VPVALLALTVVPAAAQPIRPFSTAALKAAQAKGEPVLVDAFAPWCPTCRAQAPTLDAIAASPDYAKLVILRLDYDHQIAEKKELGINQQSTLIAFKGSREVGRTLGVTQPNQIKAFAATPLK